MLSVSALTLYYSILHCITGAVGLGAGGQVWAGTPLEGMRFGMTHGHSPVLENKNRFVQRAERKLLPEIWDVRHLTPGPGTTHSWAICVSALWEKQAHS